MDPQEKFLRKQNNIYRLHELVDAMVTGVRTGTRFSFSEEVVKRLHAVAMEGLLPRPGEYRTAEVQITNSPHQCPSWIEVPALMGTLCRYLEENWEKRDLVHLSAFTMWRMNWIHPFPNGNGRTARASSYLVLCAKHGRLFPTKNSVIEQIQKDKQANGGSAAYYLAHRQVDQIYDQTKDISAALKPLEALLTGLLAAQLRANF